MIPASPVADPPLKSTLIRALTWRLSAGALAALLLTSGLWAYWGYRDFQEEAANLRESYMAEQRDHLQGVVTGTLSYIGFMRQQVERRVRETIKARTLEAYAVVSHLAAANPDLSAERLQALVRETLRPIRYDHGRGYFFAFDLAGIEQLFAAHPEMEGKDMLSVRDAEGHYVIRDMLELVQRDGEGYYAYSWGRPGGASGDFRKLAYLKLFEPLGWVIGTGEYLTDVERDVQQEVLERIERISFDGHGYVFMGDWQGLSLLGPAKGQNVLAVHDRDGLPVVQELIRLAQSGGGFLTYVMPDLEGARRSAPKLSYVAGIPDWGWYVGAGRYVDEDHMFNTDYDPFSYFSARIEYCIIKL